MTYDIIHYSLRKARRVTTIDVKLDHSLGEDVTVQLLDEDGEVMECNHAGAESQEWDFGYADPIKSDYIDSWRNVLVCDKCQAWQDFDGIWRYE